MKNCFQTIPTYIFHLSLHNHIWTEGMASGAQAEGVNQGHTTQYISQNVLMSIHQNAKISTLRIHASRSTWGVLATP